MTLQRVLFTQLPIPFVFPWQITLAVFAISIVSALLSSLIPMVKLMRKPIVAIMRMVG